MIEYDVNLPGYEVEYLMTSYSDTERPYSWGLPYLRAREVWLKGALGENCAVFILDTEDSSDHPQVQETYSKRFTNEQGPSRGGHGLHVADTVLQIAPAAAIGLVKVLTNDGSGFNDWVSKGIDWVVDLDIQQEHKIINLSLGSDQPSKLIKDAIDRAHAYGVYICAAAGNDGKDIDYPGAYDKVITTVGALENKEGDIAHYSSPGSALDLVAPGSRIFGAYRSGFAALSGTSMATPHVAACMAILLSAGYSNLDLLIETGATELDNGYLTPILPAYFETEPEPEEEETKQVYPAWLWVVVFGVIGITIALILILS